LINAATILRNTCPNHFILGRIGGDEFVALGILPPTLSTKALGDHINETFAQFNATSGKPFYVEFSYGYHEFILGTEKDFSIVLEKADELLYQSKKGRRHSIVKKAKP
jgi:GGDEF domain-containing protein